MSAAKVCQKRQQLKATLGLYANNDKVKVVVQQGLNWLNQHPTATLEELEIQERGWAAAILPATQAHIPRLTPEQVAKMIAERSQQ